MVILLSHLGRPENGPEPKNSLKPVAVELERQLGRYIAFASDCAGVVAKSAVDAMHDGGVLVLENTRFHAAETKNDPAFVDALAELGDIYVNDAFSTAHRAHASTEGLAHKLPAYIGRSMQHELEMLTSMLADPKRPLAAIVGGAKVSTKFELLGNLMREVEYMFVGGAMANTLLAASGKAIGNSLYEKKFADVARQIIAEADVANCKLVLPVDVIVAARFEPNVRTKTVDIDFVGEDQMISRHRSAHHLAGRRPSCLGADACVERTRRRFRDRAFQHRHDDDRQGRGATHQGGRVGFDRRRRRHDRGAQSSRCYPGLHLCLTAGGAFLEWLEGKKLPGVEALRWTGARTA